jgi:WD40 repeat protein
MRRRFWELGVAVAGVAALAGAVLGGCNRGRRVLDPGGAAPLPDGGMIGGGEGSPDGATGGDAGASGAGAGSAHGDGGAPPPPACAQPQPPTPSSPPVVESCYGFATYAYPLPDALRVTPAADGQSYERCGTLGTETGWRVTLSPDGTRLAALTSVGTVRLFDTVLWKEVANLASPVGTLDAVAFSPDSTQLAAISGEMGAVTLWSTADGTQTARFYGPPAPTVGAPSSALAFSSDGRRLATSLGTIIDRKTLAVTDWNGHPLAAAAPSANPAINDYAKSSIYSMRFVGGCDQRLLVYGAEAGGNAGWLRFAGLSDPAGGASGAGLGSGLFGGIMGVLASPDGRWVAVVAEGATDQAGPGIRLHDAATGALIGTDPTTTITLLGFSPTGDRLYTVTALGEIQARVVGDPLLRVVSHLATTPSDGHAVAISPRGEIIVSTASTSVWLDPVTGAVVRRALFPIANPSYSADGRLGVASGQGALFRLWNDPDASVRCAPPAPAAEKATAGMALSPDGKTLALVDGAGVAELHRILDGGTVGQAWTTIGLGLAPVFGYTAIAVANGGVRVAAQGVPAGTAPPLQPGGLSRVVVGDVASATILVSRDVVPAKGRLALSPDGARVAFQDGPLMVLDVDTGDTALAISSGQPDSFSLDSRKLAVPGPDGMQIWDLASASRDTTYGMSGAPMRNIALSPDWSVMSGIVTVEQPPSNRYEALVWRPADGSLVSQIGMVADFEFPPRFDPSGAIMATTLLEDHTLGNNWYAPHVWSAATGAELRVFGTSVPVPNDLILFAGGDRLLTRMGSGVAVWCR